MQRIILVLLIVIFGTASASQVYRWVDESGQIHYSDMPRKGAERVILPRAQTFRAPLTTRTPGHVDRSASAKPEPAVEQSYEHLAITSPAQEAVLWNIGSVLTVSVEITPPLQRGHRLNLIYDGEPVQNLRYAQGQVHLTAVYRGVHTLVAEVLDSNGRRLISSDTRTFMVRQTSIANPSNPIAHPPPVPATP